MGLNSIRRCIGQPRALQVFLTEILQQALFSPSNQTICPPKKKKEDITSAQQMKTPHKSALTVHLHTKCLKNTQQLPSRNGHRFPDLGQILSKTMHRRVVTSMLKKCDAPHQLHKIPAPSHFAAKS